MKKTFIFILLLMVLGILLFSFTAIAKDKFIINKKIDKDLPKLKLLQREDVIIFSSNRSSGPDIYAYLLNSKKKALLTHVSNKIIRLTDDNYNNAYPSLSPDGSKIAFMSERNGFNQIIIMNADGSKQFKLTNNNNIHEFYPVWSPNGEKLAYTVKGRIHVINKDGSGEIQLVNANLIAKNLSWSPDGQKIAFNSVKDGDYEIYTVNANDGSGLTKLTNNSRSDIDPDWSQDGSKIAYVSFFAEGSGEIFIMNADGSNKIRLTNDSEEISDLDPCWVNDNIIVFSSYRTGSGDLYMMNADGSNQKRLTYNSGFDRYPDWGKTYLKQMLSQSQESKDNVKADLVPGDSGTGYIPKEISLNNGKLTVYVKNNAKGAAPASTTRVIFYKSDTSIIIDIPTPSLQPGENTALTPIDFPSGVFNPDADFKIIVDFNNDVNELDESNNEADCTIIG